MKYPNDTLSKILDRLSAVSAALLPAGILAGSSVMEILIGSTCLFWIIRTIISKGNSLKYLIKNHVIITLFLWIISICISTLINETSKIGIIHDLAYLRVLIFTTAIIDISYRLPIHRYLISGLILSIIFCSSNFLSAHILGFDLIGKNVSDYMTKLDQIGRIMIIAPFTATFFGVWGLFEKKVSNKVLLLALCILSVVMVFFTKGTTVIISIAISFYFSILYFLYKKNKKLAILITIIASVLTISVFMYGYNNFDQAFRSFYHRIWIWKVSTAIWMENPLLGVGISNYETAFEAMASSMAIAPFIAPGGAVFGPVDYEEAVHAHNLVLMLLSCGGIFGLMTFISLFISIVIEIFKNITEFRAGLIGWIIAFTIIGLAGFSIYHSSYIAYFAFFTGLAVCRSRNERSA